MDYLKEKILYTKRELELEFENEDLETLEAAAYIWDNGQDKGKTLEEAQKEIKGDNRSRNNTATYR